MPKYTYTGKGVFALLLIALASKLPAQTRFQVPDTVPSYATYRYLDECIVAERREAATAKRSQKFWEDTLTATQDYYRNYNRNEGKRIANICLERVKLDTVSRKNFKDVATLLLAADRFTEVDSLVYRLAAQGDSAHYVYMSGASAYLSNQPLHYSGYLRMLDSVFNSIPSDTTSGYQIGLRSLLGGLIPDPSGNYSLTMGVIDKVEAIADTVPLKNKSHVEYMRAIHVFYNFYDYLLPSNAFDSLAKSTTTYKNYLLGRWNDLMGYPKVEVGLYGERAPDIEGSFWYSNKTEDSTIQQTDSSNLFEDGKVTALYFISGGCHSLYKRKRSIFGDRTDVVPAARGDGCFAGIRRIKEIMQAYPNINLVLVSRTFGSFGFDGRPLEPQNEADIHAEYFLGFHKLKANLVVYNTEFMRLATFDNRKIDSENPNELSYEAKPGSFVLVDENRQIFHQGPISYKNIYSVDRRLKAVMSRPANQIK